MISFESNIVVEQDILRLIGDLKQLPAFPTVALEILNLALDDTTPIKEVAKLIETDPSITSKIIRLVNSPAYGFGRAITSVADAISCLGLKAVRNAVLSISVFDMIIAKDTNLGLDRKGFWVHSFACGVCGELMAEYKNWNDPPTFFVAGILHDIGKLVLDTCVSEHYSRVVQEAYKNRSSIIEAEQAILGLDHTIVGKWVAEKWNFPEKLVRVIWLHHQPPDFVLEDVDDCLLRAIQLANLIVKNQRIGNAGDNVYTVESKPLLETLGFNESVLSDIKHRLFEEVDSRLEGINSELKSTDVFFASLQKANQQLGELYEDLDVINRSISIKSERFSILNELNTSFQPNQEVRDILRTGYNYFQQKLGVGCGFIYIINKDFCCVDGIVWDSKDNYVEPITISLGNDKELLMEYSTGTTTFIKVALSRLKHPHQFGQSLKASIGRNALVITSIFQRNEIIGKIAVVNDTMASAFPSLKHEELCAFAGSIGKAIQHIKAYRRLMFRTEALTTAIWKREQLHKELLRCERLVAVGKMAAGAAHEINNPLSIISGRAQMLALKESNPEIRQQIDIIVEQSNRIAKIVSSLLGFARPPSPELKEISINDLINRVISMMENRMGLQNIIVTKKLGKDIPKILADEAQLEQVFVNFMINAQQAMEEGGEITISSELSADGKWVQIKFADTGVGIPPENLPVIFEPFFSTKEGVGTGLGLSLSYGIIKAHDGTINVESILHEGTTFTVEIPVRVNREAPLDETEIHKKPDYGDITYPDIEGKKVLVIDDEKDIQNILREVLTDEGYVVEVASDGSEGFWKAKRFGPDLVILDIKMPVKNGFDFLAEMNKEFSRIPVIVITGVATKDEIEMALKAGVRRCVKKPFSISKLLELIKEIMDFEINGKR